LVMGISTTPKRERFARIRVQREAAIDAHGERLEEEGEEPVLRLGRGCVLERQADERPAVVLLAVGITASGQEQGKLVLAPTDELPDRNQAGRRAEGSITLPS
jgi:hypothetical protein